MKIISLFDGISCGRVALEKAGIFVEKYIAYEIDENAIKISNKNYPDIIQCGDVIGADFTQYKNYDLLLGGSPCQSLSITTGKNRTNLDGKSKLFFEFVHAKNEINAKYFLFENVASMNQESKDVISKLLDCEPILINSSEYSAQDRERYYWTNIPFENSNSIFKSPNLILKDIIEDEVQEKYYYNCDFDYYGENKKVIATLHINGHDILKRVNNINFKSPTLTAVCGGNQHKKIYVNNRCRKLTPLEYERLQTLPDNYTAGFADSIRYKAIGNGWTVNVIADILKNLK